MVLKNSGSKGHPGMALIGVDWGTSSLRVARIDERGAAIEERSSARGILTVKPGEFPAVLNEACGDWMAQERTRVLVSGMAGSRQGWVEAPYIPCPAGFGDIASKLTWVEPGRVGIVPGLSSHHDGVPDVLRGEETQVFGALALLQLGDATAVLPGTHSKWVRVEAGRIDRFVTFMTGEFYALLRRHSILGRTMEAPGSEVLDEEAFCAGITQAMKAGSLLKAAFSARTLSLFDLLPARSGASYLSGLVIGEELRSQQFAVPNAEVVVIAGPELARRYELALRFAGMRPRCVGSQATWRGLSAIAQQLRDTA